MFEEIFNHDVLNEIDARSDACIESHGIDPDRNCWVLTEGVENIDMPCEATVSIKLILEVETDEIGVCLIEIYKEDDKYVIFTYNKDLLHRNTFGHGDAKIVTKDQMPETIGEITHNFVNTILDKGV